MGEGTPHGNAVLSAGRRAYLPSPTLPLVYFAGAHAALGAVWLALMLRPDLPGSFHYHPRTIALVHLITIGWISGSILGALYIVAPIALGAPLRASSLDAVACASFWIGAIGMVLGFWTGRYDLLAPASLLVIGAIAFVGGRAALALWTSRVPSGVSLHIVLAFVNIVGAGTAGVLMAAHRTDGALPWPPLALALAHGHLAVLGWAVMMIFGVAYRLIPMFVPAAMPSGPALAVSAVLLEVGTLGLAASLMTAGPLAPWALCVIAAFASFFVRIRGIVREKRPRPAELPPRDWSTWQAHAALLYLLLAAGLGLRLSMGGTTPALAWTYGTAGLVGFVSQMVVGIQGRLLPLQAWYRSMEHGNGNPPPVSVHRLVDPRFAFAIFVLWLTGVPLLMGGLAGAGQWVLAAAAALLLAGTVVNAAYAARMIRVSRRS